MFSWIIQNFTFPQRSSWLFPKFPFLIFPWKNSFAHQSFPNNIQPTCPLFQTCPSRHEGISDQWLWHWRIRLLAVGVKTIKVGQKNKKTIAFQTPLWWNALILNFSPDRDHSELDMLPPDGRTQMKRNADAKQQWANRLPLAFWLLGWVLTLVHYIVPQHRSAGTWTVYD